MSTCVAATGLLLLLLLTGWCIRKNWRDDCQDEQKQPLPMLTWEQAAVAEAEWIVRAARSEACDE